MNRLIGETSSPEPVEVLLCAAPSPTNVAAAHFNSSNHEVHREYCTPEKPLGRSLVGEYRSPLEHVKRHRRVAARVLSLVAPVESSQRQSIHEEEAWERYQLLSHKYRVGLVCTRIEQEEEAQRCVIEFAERSERRMISRKGSQQLLQRQSPTTVDNNSPAVSSPASPDQPLSPERRTSVSPPQGRRRTLGATKLVADDVKRFLALCDALDASQIEGRSALEKLEGCERYYHSVHTFYDGYYEFVFHRFDNVPRVDPHERISRDRCMIMLDEYRCRKEIVLERTEDFADMCEVLSPFIPPASLRLLWRDLSRSFFQRHFDFAQGPVASEEHYERHQLRLCFYEETRRVLASVHASVVLREPDARACIRRDERFHRASLVSFAHPAMIRTRASHNHVLLRRCFRKFVGRRAYRMASVVQREWVRSMESQAQERLRVQCFASWRQWHLRLVQLRTVDSAAAFHRQRLAASYYALWARWTSRRTRLQRTECKLQKRMSEHERGIPLRYFAQWRRHVNLCRAEALARRNELRFLQKMATRWYWGSWTKARRKTYRVKMFSLERKAQIWCLASYFRSWGPTGFLALCNARRKKHHELAQLLSRVEKSRRRISWAQWQRFVKRRKQIRLSLKLERLNNNYTKLRRLADWLRLAAVRHTVRKVNGMFLRVMPQLLRPLFHGWRALVTRKRERIAEAILARTRQRVCTSILKHWGVWAHRHRYRGLVISEGQLELLRKRNQFRYAIFRFVSWTAPYVRRRLENSLGALCAANECRCRRPFFALWRQYLIRKPQLWGLERIQRKSQHKLLQKCSARWFAFVQKRKTDLNKDHIARSLLRKNESIALRSAMRRLCTRTRGAARCLRVLVPQSTALLQRVMFHRWIRSTKHLLNMRVASNLALINWHKVHVLQFWTWRRCARRARQKRALVLMTERNLSNYRRLVWSRSFAVLARRVRITQSLEQVRLASCARLIDVYFWAWRLGARAHRHRDAVQTLHRKHTIPILRNGMAKLLQFSREQKVRRVHCLVTMSKLGGDTALRRYYRKFYAWLKRRIHRKMALGTTALLREFWYRRAYWASWIEWRQQQAPQRQQRHVVGVSTVTTTVAVSPFASVSTDASLRSAVRTAVALESRARHSVLALDEADDR